VNKVIIIKTGRNKFNRINLDDLKYIQASKGRTIVFCKEKLNTATSFKDVVAVLSGNLFQCHRSYAVNIDFVESFTNDTILVGSKNIPLGAIYKSAFLDFMFAKNILIKTTPIKKTKSKK
tara:strand:- start:37 stop:396 length:360 start_codon:yes stop_codon:yes gene_type:complete